MSMQQFYICGAPRMGTAFLANVFNYGNDIWCSHEMERDILRASPDDQQAIVTRRLEDKPHMMAGNCSSGMLNWRFEDDTKVAILFRDWNEVFNSLEDCTLEWAVDGIVIETEPIVVELMKDHQRFVEAHPLSQHYYFDEIFTVQGLTSLWNYLVPCMIPPTDRFKELVRHKTVLKDFDYPFIQADPTSFTNND